MAGSLYAPSGAVRLAGPGGLVLIGKAAVLKTAGVNAPYRFESCALRLRGFAPSTLTDLAFAAYFQPLR